MDARAKLTAATGGGSRKVLSVTGAGDARVNGRYEVTRSDAAGTPLTYTLTSNPDVTCYSFSSTWKIVHKDVAGFIYSGMGSDPISAEWSVGRSGKAPPPVMAGGSSTR